jgi:hypothetical protein
MAAVARGLGFATNNRSWKIYSSSSQRAAWWHAFLEGVVFQFGALPFQVLYALNELAGFPA